VGRLVGELGGEGVGERESGVRVYGGLWGRRYWEAEARRLKLQTKNLEQNDHKKAKPHRNHREQG
jgi:hypothetical protein